MLSLPRRVLFLVLLFFALAPCPLLAQAGV